MLVPVGSGDRYGIDCLSAFEYTDGMRVFGVALFGLMALGFTALAFCFPYAIYLYGPVCLVVWFLFLMSLIHSLRPRS